MVENHSRALLSVLPTGCGLWRKCSNIWAPALIQDHPSPRALYITLYPVSKSVYTRCEGRYPGRTATWLESGLPHLPHHRAQYPNTVGVQGLSPNG